MFCVTEGGAPDGDSWDVCSTNAVVVHEEKYEEEKRTKGRLKPPTWKDAP
jgi:hypothetical protein